MKIAARKSWLAVSFAVVLLSGGCSHNGHRVTAEFTTTPANDTALQEWLKSQPTVSAASIHVVRTASKVTLVFETSLPHRLDPDVLQTEFTKLGYSGKIQFRDCNIGK